MKRILYVLLVSTLFLSSCQVYKPGMESAQYDPLPIKLGNLDYNFTHENFSGYNNLIFNMMDKTISSEIQKNIIQGEGNLCGTLSVNCNELYFNQKYGLAVLTGFTFFIPNLFGMPINILSADIGLEFMIKNINNITIKKYYYEKSGKTTWGFYHQGKDVYVLVIDIIKDILKQFKKDLTNDASNLMAQLNSVSNNGESSFSLEELQTLGVIGNKTQQDSQTAQQVQTQTTDNKPVVTERILSDVDKNIPLSNMKSENTFVLIIANENYEFVDDVEFALNDGNTFKEYCIKTLGVPEKQVWLYENASYGIINSGVSKMIQAMNLFDNTNAIIYYCGHGIPDEKTGDAYIIPTDGNGKDMATCYSLNTLYNTFSQTNALNVTYFMDACFTGAKKDGSMIVAARGVAREPKKETLSGNTIVFSATSADETAMTFKEKQHGLFTYYLLKKLQETKGNVTYEELYNYILNKVKRESFLTNDKLQTPMVATSPSMQDNWKNKTLK